jgi:hypothetical protein
VSAWAGQEPWAPRDGGGARTRRGRRRARAALGWRCLLALRLVAQAGALDVRMRTYVYARTHRT